MHPDEYRSDLQRELNEILGYWLRYSPDPVNGGFYGKIDNDNQVYIDAPRGIVLYSRILWTFAAAFNHSNKPVYLAMAEKAYMYIVDHFADKEYGGFYWSVDQKGQVHDDRKQIYGLAFCVYGLSEFYKASKKQPVLDAAILLYRQVEQHAFDGKRKGYHEAFKREWKPIDDIGLNPKYAHAEKTMNTHLHLLEAYTCLYTVWRNAGLRGQIENLLEVFAHHIVDDDTTHLNLFFDQDWNVKSNLVSFGHDIEAAWLLQQAAETIRHPGWIMTMKSLAVKIADAAAEGLDADGGMKHELEDGKWANDKHWWPQAEAMVGFYNAYQVSGDERWLKKSIRSWQFVNQCIKDSEHGEWFWGVHADHSIMEGEDKAGFWKCPYHNGRACLELIRRIAPEFALRGQL